MRFACAYASVDTEFVTVVAQEVELVRGQAPPVNFSQTITFNNSREADDEGNLKKPGYAHAAIV